MKQTLDEQELADIRRLAEACEEHEGIRLKLNWEMLQDRQEGRTNDLLYYKDGKLAGFLGIYIIIPSAAELSGMVHPDFRRQGIFTEMMEAAIRLLAVSGPPELIYICPRDSISGTAFMKQRGQPYAFSEYGMERAAHAEVLPPSQGRYPEFTLRIAEERDAKTIAELNQAGFNMPAADADSLASSRLLPQELIYLIEVDGRAVGKLGVLTEGSTAFIFGFCMRPEERGRGIGRAALAAVMERLQRERNMDTFELEVAASNERALGLYESCGFRRTNVIDYYKQSLL
ncbi:GNAT family N-acetyltransferase [Paenibacillus sp. H1-7]|uniref:GNAT family N-acetyltransferase n=1 Tax=Paenibacillus sp. H1-7 TaxID=2282849 RepID=UPI001EF9A608|nr:GNAT family N-acetyltransferase [Paenibacillus sp. H1-7]ULL17796.1 GNAT family N-acetyltransferase [Paenibacillus sp. H1-7]